MFNEDTVALIAVRSAAELPSLAPAVPPTSGVVKFSAATPVHVPVLRLVAVRLY